MNKNGKNNLNLILIRCSTTSTTKAVSKRGLKQLKTYFIKFKLIKINHNSKGLPK